MPVKLKGRYSKQWSGQQCYKGQETWATTKIQEKRIEVIDMRMLRWICVVTRKDNFRNQHIRGTTRVKQASEVITERRLNW